MAKPDLLSRMRERAKKNVRSRGPKCTVCTLEPDMLTAVRQLRADGYTLSVISATLREEGSNVNAWTLTRHFLNHEPKR